MAGIWPAGNSDPDARKEHVLLPAAFETLRFRRFFFYVNSEPKMAVNRSKENGNESLPVTKSSS